MATYAHILHYVPEDVWIAVQARAQREKWPLQGLTVRLLADYASGAVTPTGDPRGATLVARTPPATPLRTAVITFVGQPRTVRRLQCAAAGECGGNLLLMNHEGEVVGRFQSVDVESWFFDD